MQILLILNDPPYGTERCYNGLRLALAIIKSEPETRVTVSLMADCRQGTDPAVRHLHGRARPDRHRDDGGGAAQQHGGTRGRHARGRQGAGILIDRRGSSRACRQPEMRPFLERLKSLLAPSHGSAIINPGLLTASSIAILGAS